VGARTILVGLLPKGDGHHVADRAMICTIATRGAMCLGYGW
jgi:hypothetical protein